MSQRVSLIVGAQRYDDPVIRPLSCAAQDAVDLAGFLRHRAGFDVAESLIDPDSDDEVLSRVGEMVKGRGAGDLFLFCFAGHGVSHNGRHLLLCPKVRYGRLQYLKQAIPVDLLRDETALPGLDRVFILDACRSDLLKTRTAGAAGMSGEKLLRDIVCGAPAATAGSFAMLCSCGEGETAAEIPQLRSGMFTAALMNIMMDRMDRGEAIRLSDDLEQALSIEMARLSGEHGVPTQQPWIERHRGVPLLVPGKDHAPTASKPRTGRVTIVEPPALLVTSVPAGARVWVNGQDCSSSPIRVELPAGQHAVKAELPGHHPWEKRIRFEGTGDAELRIELKAKPKLWEAFCPMTAGGAQKVQREAASALGVGGQQVVDIGGGVKVKFVLIAKELRQRVQAYRKHRWFQWSSGLLALILLFAIFWFPIVVVRDLRFYRSVTAGLSRPGPTSRQVILDARAYLASAGLYSTLVHHDQQVRDNLKDYENAMFDAEYKEQQSFGAERQNDSDAIARFSHRTDFIRFWNPVANRYRSEPGSARLRNFDELNRLLQWDQTLIEVDKLKEAAKFESLNQAGKSLDQAASTIDSFLSMHLTSSKEKASALAMRDDLRRGADGKLLEAIEQDNEAARRSIASGAKDIDNQEAKIVRAATGFTHRPGAEAAMSQRASEIASQSAERWERAMYVRLQAADNDARNETWAVNKGPKWDSARAVARQYILSGCPSAKVRKNVEKFVRWFDEQRERMYEVTIVRAEFSWGQSNSRPTVVFFDVDNPQTGNCTHGKTGNPIDFDEALSVPRVTWISPGKLTVKALRRGAVFNDEIWFAKDFVVASHIGSALNGRLELPGISKFGNESIGGGATIEIKCVDALPPDLPGFDEKQK